MGSNNKSVLNRRAGFLFLVLAAAGMLTVRGVFSQAPSQPSRRAIHLPDANPQLPFSDGILAGNTLYLAGQDGKLVAIDLVARKPAWEFQTEASRKNLASLSKADGAPNYEAVFASNFYDDMIVGVHTLQAVGPILASPVVAEDVVYVGSADGNLYALN